MLNNNPFNFIKLVRNNDACIHNFSHVFELILRF